MKRTLLLLTTLAIFSKIPIYGQSCSGNFSVSRNTICLTQSITFQVSACVGDGTVTWAYATSMNGSYTNIGTSPINGFICNTSFSYTPTSAGTFWYKATFVSSAATPPPCSWNPVQVEVGAGDIPPTPTITASTTCPNVTLSIAGPLAEYSKEWYKQSDPNPNWDVISGQTGNSTIAPHAPNQYRVVYKNAYCTGSPSNAISVSQYGIAPYYTTSTTSDVIFTYESGNSVTTVKDNCGKLLAGFEGSGGVGGGTFPTHQLKARASFDNIIKTYTGRPYLTRHYDFTPSPNATYPATPTSYAVRLYFTQAEFDAFNAATSAQTPKLPRQPNVGFYGYFDNNGDFINDGSIYNGKTPLRVLLAHGMPSVAEGGPETYPSVDELYNPVTGISNADIQTSWNTNYNVWQVTIRNLTSFSGFFITTEGAQPLPVTLLNFKAQKQENLVALNWQTTEETNSDRFEIERSIDAKRWSTIGEVGAQGESKSLASYSFKDVPLSLQERAGVRYYRLKMLDRDGTFAYSRLASVDFQRTTEIRISPNPAIRELHFTSDASVIGYKLMNPAGITIVEKIGLMKSDGTIKLPDVQDGIYLLQLTQKEGIVHSKQVVIAR
jgi:hypothetical protein